jgi:hypothetical protein
MQPKAPFALRFWVVLSAFLTCAGWLLSAANHLNVLGYLFALLMGAAFAAALKNRLGLPRILRPGKLRSRFTRLFPLAFLAVAALAIFGGVLYAPTNPDGLTQRIPRVLNWMAEGKWHWIENAPSSFNTRATGFEWLMAPMLVLLKTDRLVFLLNAFSFLLLPGLVYSVFHRLGVRRRTAWYWMWVLPTGYSFVLQAGSIANDLSGAVLALAALDFALRAQVSNRATEAWLSLVSAALLTNAKASNLPLLLPWALAFLPGLKVLLRRPIGTLATLIIAAGVSLLPVTYFNIQRLGDWSGAKTEAPLFNELTPDVALAGNALNLAAQNFVPPVFPMASSWNENAYKHLPDGLRERMARSFEPGGAHLKLLEMQLEVSAGLGFGVCLLLLITWIRSRFVFTGGTPAILPAQGSRSLNMLVRWSAWMSLLVYMAMTGLSTSARLITPYYALLIPVLITGPGASFLTRRRWWRAIALVVFGLAGMLVIINPARPLWPARIVLRGLAEAKPESRIIQKAALLYQSYAGRSDALAAVKRHLPVDARNVGLISFVSASSIETSLWRPFGSRRIWWLKPESPPAELARKHIGWVIVGTDSAEARKGALVFDQWFEAWRRTHHAEIVAQENVRLAATGEPIPWYVMRVQLPGNPSAEDIVPDAESLPHVP